MTLTPKQVSTLWRFAKIVLCEAGAVAIATAFTLLQGHGTDLGFSDATVALVVAVATPLIAAAEKWLHWQETQP